MFNLCTVHVTICLVYVSLKWYTQIMTIDCPIQYDPYGYGGQEVLQSAVCKMQVLESSWCDSTQIWKSENYGILQFHSQSMRKTWQGDEGKQRDGCSKSQSLKAGAPMFLGRRRWTSQPKKIENFLFFCLSFLFVSSCTKC